jgi:type II secretory pathway pseudopilin PulG
MHNAGCGFRRWAGSVNGYMITTRHERTISGFTLVEILVTVGLIILLLALVGYPILTGIAYMEKGVARADAQSAARLAIDAMTRELAEAMYVFDPPPGGTFLAFLPTRGGLNKAAPITPETFAVRYWRALRDPAYAYGPFYQPDANPVNPFYLARSEVADPSDRADPWNDSGGALTRATFWYPDSYQYPSGSAWPTSQMGYPWLEAVRLYGAGPPPQAAYDFYREHAVGLTPDHVDYDVPSAGFSPARITEEALVPWTSAFPRDYSRYRARYGLWAAFGQWNPDTGQFTSMAQTTVKVYMGDPRTLAYQTVVDGTTGDVWVTRVSDGARIYDTAAYPLRDVSDPNQGECACGIDYDRGEVRFDFPAEDRIAAAASMYVYDLADVALGTTLSGVTNLDPTGESRQIVRGSATVWVTDDSGNRTYYEQVDPPPAIPGGNTIGARRFALQGLQLIFDDNPSGPQGPGDGETINIRYRYRNNPEDQLVVATYATKAIINIALTVSKRDIAARTPQASRQDVTLVAKVKLKNVPR